MGIQEGPFNKSKDRWKILSYYNLFVSSFCFLTSATLFLLLVFLPPSDQICIAGSVIYKRAAEAIHYDWVNFGDYFYPSSVYRHASPERDPAWESLVSRWSNRFWTLLENSWRYCRRRNRRITKRIISTSSIPRHAMEAISRRWARSCTRNSPPDELLSESFPQFFFTFFSAKTQLQNLLRRYVHMSLEDSARVLLRKDTDQCIELLRNQLMCSGDITPFLELRVPTFSGSRPDLRTKHKCRNYNDLKDWARKNSQGQFHDKWDTKRWISEWF